ncbi:hypothetical protein SNE40_007441 [Patella caerulea]|uniref:Dual specificity protein phosphatase 15 n=1 Tax=Patella caerulea TaxID=87958 RepID=A0AAN8JWT5_PATCE
MGNGMNKIIKGVYIGNFRDSKDQKQLTENNITHILSIHDNATPILPDKEYLCLIASDHPAQDLTQFISQSNDFIHKARLSGGNVIIHCLAGVSRSVTLTAAYIMTVTNLQWRDTLNSIRGARSCANPNFGFQRQLQKFQEEMLEEEKKRFFAFHGKNPFDDESDCKINLSAYQKFLLGNAEDESTYPLPHNAYTDKEKRQGYTEDKKSS